MEDYGEYDDAMSVGTGQGGHINGMGDSDSKFRKIFVGGLPHNLTQPEFKAYFEQFGPLDDCVILLDKRTQKPRGFGFVTYQNLEDVDKVMANKDKHQIQGKWVDCKRSVPVSEMKDQKS